MPCYIGIHNSIKNMINTRWIDLIMLFNWFQKYREHILINFIGSAYKAELGPTLDPGSSSSPEDWGTD